MVGRMYFLNLGVKGFRAPAGRAEYLTIVIIRHYPVTSLAVSSDLAGPGQTVKNRARALSENVNSIQLEWLAKRYPTYKILCWLSNENRIYTPGGLPYGKVGDARREFLFWPQRGTKKGVVQAFFDP